MDSAREAEYEAAVAMNLLKSVPDPGPSWRCPSEFQLLEWPPGSPPLAACDPETTEDGGELDTFFLHASQQIDMLVAASDAISSGQELNADSAVTVPPPGPITRSKTKDARGKKRFSSPVSSEEVQEVRRAGIPKKTRAQTRWAGNVWKDWAKQRLTRITCNGDEAKHELREDFSSMSVESMQFWLSKFILEDRRRDGSCYPPDSLYCICTGLNRCLKDSNRADINFFTDSGFIVFKQTLDAVMKDLKSTGKYRRKKAEVLTLAQEDSLWNKGILGNHNPQVLLDTLVFYIGLYFAVRGEHRRIRHNPSQLRLFEPAGSVPYLVFTEDVSKTNQGGLLHQQKAPKEVVHHGNSDNPQRCLVRLYKLYNEHCPPNCPDDAFFLKPLANPKGIFWYAHVPVGHNVLSNTVKRLCAEAGIDGYFTNHSLRATAATRMFDAGVDEQLIMHRTGHSSSSGVRSYKRITESLKEMNVLNVPPAKREKLDTEVKVASSDDKLDKQHFEFTASENKNLASFVSFCGATCNNFTVNINY